MNWKEEAMDRLRKYDAMRQSVKNIPQELQRLELEALQLRSTQTDAPCIKASGNGREDALISNFVHRQELQQAFEQANLWVQTTDRALSSLTPEEKLILHRLYICPQRGAVDRLCGDLGVEQSSVYRKRDKALYRFTISLYGTA